MSGACLFCNKGPFEGVTVFRVNAKGQSGVWACAKHIGQTDVKVDDDLREITDLISKAGGPSQ